MSKRLLGLLKLSIYGCSSVVLSVLSVHSLAADEPAPWKVAVFLPAAPFTIEIEQALKAGLAQWGYIEGQNLVYLPTVLINPRIEDFADTAQQVYSTIAEQPDVFAMIGTQASVPSWKILEATDIPMVFGGVTFPIEGELISAYDQPTGQNITGIGYSISPAQRLELLRQLFPDTQRFRRIAFVYSGQVLQDALYMRDLRAAGDVAAWQVVYIDYFDYAQNHTSLRLLIDQLQHADPDLVFGWYSLDTLGNDTQAFKELLDQLRKPLIAVTSKGVDEGAIGGVLTDHQHLGEEMARMIHAIFQGTAPGTIPPVEPTRYLIELNLKRAQELDIEFAPDIIDAAQRLVQ